MVAGCHSLFPSKPGSRRAESLFRQSLTVALCVTQPAPRPQDPHPTPLPLLQHTLHISFTTSHCASPAPQHPHPIPHPPICALAQSRKSTSAWPPSLNSQSSDTDATLASGFTLVTSIESTPPHRTWLSLHPTQCSNNINSPFMGNLPASKRSRRVTAPNHHGVPHTQRFTFGRSRTPFR